VIRLLVVPMLLVAPACVRREAVPPPTEVRQSPVGAQPAITLERTSCFGSCPVYRVAVTPSGEVTYEGKAHVRRVGSDTLRISQQQVDSLLTEIEQAGYFTFDDRYVASEPACGRYATDAPSVITSVTLRGRTKTITHDYGCTGVPGALTIVERRIDETLGSSRWTGR
jgi:uncharacterized protein DUF6438